jgi:hypothetical protein
MRPAFAGDRERLARTAPSPDRSVGWPSCELEGELPSPDAREVVLPNSVNWMGDVADAALVDVGVRPEVADPGGAERIDFIEVAS